MQGNLENENFIALLQSLGAQKATGVLSVAQSDSGEARIYFREGRVVYAHRGSSHDHKLVMNLLQEKRGRYEFKEGAKPSLETINQSLDNFLLEVGRLRFAFEISETPSPEQMEPNQIPRILNPTRLREMRFSADDSWMVIHLDGAHTVGQMVALERRPGHVFALLKRLQNLGMIELPVPPAVQTKAASTRSDISPTLAPFVPNPDRLTQMHFSLDEFHIIMNIDGIRTMAGLQSFERTAGQLQLLVQHLVLMGLIELRENTGQVASVPEVSRSSDSVALPSTSVSVSTTITTSVNVDTLPDLDPNKIPVILDEPRFKETRFSADDNWLVIHFDGRNIEALQKIEKKRGHLKMVIYRLINKGLIELRSPSVSATQAAPTAKVEKDKAASVTSSRVPTLVDRGNSPVLKLNSEELALVMQIDGERSIEQLQRFESSPGQLASLISRLESERLCEIRSSPLRLRVGLSSDLGGQSLAIDQSVLETWEKRLGKSVWRATLHLPSGIEQSCEVMASTGAESYVLLSPDVMQNVGANNGVPALIYPE